MYSSISVRCYYEYYLGGKENNKYTQECDLPNNASINSFINNRIHRTPYKHIYRFNLDFHINKDEENEWEEKEKFEEKWFWQE